MKKWFLIDICGELAEDITELSTQYQTREKAIQYGLDYWNSLEKWQKDLRTEFYITYGTFNKKAYSFNFSEYHNCMK